MFLANARVICKKTWILCLKVNQFNDVLASMYCPCFVHVCSCIVHVVVHVLFMFCPCLFMFCLYFCPCFVHVLCMFCACFVHVLFMFCSCFFVDCMRIWRFLLFLYYILRGYSLKTCIISELQRYKFGKYWHYFIIQI